MNSSKRVLKVPLYAWTLESLESDARRLNTTASDIAIIILEKRRIAPACKTFRTKGALRPLPFGHFVAE